MGELEVKEQRIAYIEGSEKKELLGFSEQIGEISRSVRKLRAELPYEDIQLQFKYNEEGLDNIRQQIKENTDLYMGPYTHPNGKQIRIMIEEDILGIGNWGCLKCHSYNPQENSLCATCNSFRPLETYPNILTSPLTVFFIHTLFSHIYIYISIILQVTNMEVEAVEFRRKEERQLISGLEKEGGEFYMINSKWLKEWKSFVFNKAMGGDVSKSINKRIGIFPPGPISNHELFVLNPEKRELKSNLLLV